MKHSVKSPNEIMLIKYVCEYRRRRKIDRSRNALNVHTISIVINTYQVIIVIEVSTKAYLAIEYIPVKEKMNFMHKKMKIEEESNLFTFFPF